MATIEAQSDGQPQQPEENEVLSAVASRRSCRAFLRDKPVPLDLLRGLIGACIRAPSSKNSQPWAVTMVHGEARDVLSKVLYENYMATGGEEPPPLYKNRPPADVMPPEWSARMFEQGKTFHEHLGITREDADGRLKQRARNFLFFDAPVELLFHVPAECATAGMLLHAGLFISHVTLALESVGLASCLQISIAKFSPLVTQTLGMGDRVVVCGCAVGYADPSARDFSYRCGRAPVGEILSEVHTVPPSSPEDTD